MGLALVNLFGSYGELGSQKRSRIFHFFLITLSKLNITEKYQANKLMESLSKLMNKDHKSRPLCHTLSQGFSISALPTFWARSFCRGGLSCATGCQ